MDTSVGLKCPRHSNMSPTKSNTSATKLPPPPPPTKKCPKVSALVFFLFFYTKPMRVLTFCFLKIASGVTVPTPYTVCLQPTNSSRQCFFSKKFVGWRHPYTVCLQPTNSSRQCFFSKKVRGLEAPLHRLPPTHELLQAMLF